MTGISTKEELFETVRQLEKIGGELAQVVWNDPEISGEEVRASGRFRELFREEGFAIVDEPRMPNAFYAEYGHGHPVIAFAGEYDALPGLSQKAAAHKEPVEEGGPGHGCGHNLLGTGCALAAIAVKRYLQSAAEAGEEISGTVRFYGCPEEEALAGKTGMAYLGMFEGCDFCLTWHPMTANRVLDTQCLACARVEYHFSGVSAHAAFGPERGRSAWDAVELMNVGANYLREHVPDRTRIHYAPLPPLFVPNVVPDRAGVTYMVRAADMPTMRSVKERLDKVARGAAMMTETEAEIRLIGGTCEVARNSAFADLYYRNMLEAGAPEYTEEELAFAREVQATLDPELLANEIRAYGTGGEGMAAGVEPRNHWMKVPVNSGSDAGDLSYIMPTMSAEFAAWAMGCSPHTWQACACSGTTLGEKGAFYAGRAMAGTAYDLLHDPEARERITEEFHANVTVPYEPMLSEDFLKRAAE
ncbi:MAG: amidohydrolase [Lachnospiraceae bacterium]|nr:amidohydrolase [Lachnospiraceae bacterium]